MTWLRGQDLDVVLLGLAWVALAAAVEQLARRGYVDGADAEHLGTAYRYLRTVEHRLQMIADEQERWSSIAQLAAEYETIAAAAQRYDMALELGRLWSDVEPGSPTARHGSRRQWKRISARR